MDPKNILCYRAFQYHFTPDKSNGRISIEMVSALWALLEKYFPEILRMIGWLDVTIINTGKQS
ncbi:MAG: hypothetical protein Ct9H90mP13_09040 [Pseudomonadota bacterium]|nr:MAG: hypothetical protein Ct9H90mP13_09040 [Pseudomonadota bacterium]